MSRAGLRSFRLAVVLGALTLASCTSGEPAAAPTTISVAGCSPVQRLLAVDTGSIGEWTADSAVRVTAGPPGPARWLVAANPGFGGAAHLLTGTGQEVSVTSTGRYGHVSVFSLSDGTVVLLAIERGGRVVGRSTRDGATWTSWEVPSATGDRTLAAVSGDRVMLLVEDGDDRRWWLREGGGWQTIQGPTSDGILRALGGRDHGFAATVLSEHFEPSAAFETVWQADASGAWTKVGRRSPGGYSAYGVTPAAGGPIVATVRYDRNARWVLWPVRATADSLQPLACETVFADGASLVTDSAGTVWIVAGDTGRGLRINRDGTRTPFVLEGLPHPIVPEYVLLAGAADDELLVQAGRRLYRVTAS
ncbi:hypothetical protein [Cryptosporangium minutisporangium]|uniref:hypothetical protein n=1 Tax=Cryptosporangium minutisporangium TaxID=113569 RepID=UPI0031E55D02